MGWKDGYLTQQQTALAIGQVYRDFFSAENLSDHFPKMEVVMHSMGNHLWFNGICEAPPNIKFDNIYMVAAVR